jgi:hypothetical protein
MTIATLPGPWLDHEVREKAPWRSSAGIVKFIEFPVRKPGMSRRAFHLYWQRHHSPHVMNVTGFSQFMRKYMTGHVEPFQGLPLLFKSVPRFEGCGQVWINGMGDAAGWLAHPLYAELIAPDEAQFIDHAGGGEVLITREETIYDSDRDLAESGLIKLQLIVERKAGLARDEFHLAASEAAKAVASNQTLGGTLRRLVVSHRLGDPYPDWMPPTTIDAVFEMWFDDYSGLQLFVSTLTAGETSTLVSDELVDVHNLRALVTRLNVVHDEFSFQPTVTQPVRFNWSA